MLTTYANHLLFQAVLQAAVAYPKVYEEWQKRVLGYFIDLTARFIERQVAQGDSRAEDSERLAQALILMNNAVVNDNMTRQVHDDPAAVAGVLAGVWNAAIFGKTR